MKEVFTLSADDLHDLYKKLNDTLVLPEEEVETIATTLLDAPEDQFVTKKMRLQAILAHTNMSLSLYERVFSEFDAHTLTAENSNVLHMLISNPNSTVDYIFLLERHAAESDNKDWFNHVIDKTYELAEYQLNLTYNDEFMFKDETVRKHLQHTIDELKKFYQRRTIYVPR